MSETLAARPCARFWGSDGTLCATHSGRFAGPSEMRCGLAASGVRVRDEGLRAALERIAKPIPEGIDVADWIEWAQTDAYAALDLAATPTPPEIDEELDGIVHRAHVPCCWCGEHHEEGR